MGTPSLTPAVAPEPGVALVLTLESEEAHAELLLAALRGSMREKMNLPLAGMATLGPSAIDVSARRSVKVSSPLICGQALVLLALAADWMKARLLWHDRAA